MTVDQQPAEPAPSVPLVDPVLAAYTRRMRKQGLWYGGVLVVIIAVVIAWVAVVMSHSEIAHAHLHSATDPAPAIAAAAPSATQQLAWSSSDQLALGQPFWSGTVVTFAGHTVTGRNARTGAATWTYTRTDMPLCEVAETQGQTIALFNREGNCDEIDAFDTTTGKRSWSRTLDSDSQITNGVPAVAISQFTLLLTSPNQVHAIVPSGSSSAIDRWNTNAPAGCTDLQSALGSNGVLITQKCQDGNYLQLRDAYAQDKVNNDPNPKLQLWRVKLPADVVPVSADVVISAYEPSSGDLIFYGANGAESARLPLDTHPDAASAKPVVTSADGIELIWLDGHTYEIDAATNALKWKAATTGPPTLASSELVATTDAGVVLLDPNSGAVTTTFATRSIPAASAVFPVGSGFLIGRSAAGGGPTAVYR